MRDMRNVFLLGHRRRLNGTVTVVATRAVVAIQQQGGDGGGSECGAIMCNRSLDTGATGS